MSIKKIYLIGLMGAGKSTVGKLLARSLGWQFMDLDHEIETMTGKAIPTIFKEAGEAQFRDYETQTLLKTVDLSKIVIACGGGVVTRVENVDFLKKENTVWLDISPEEAAARLEYTDDRPLLSECKDTLHELSEILDARQHAYTEIAKLRIPSGEFPAEIISCNIVKELEEIDA